MTDEVSIQTEETKSPAIQVKKDRNRPETSEVVLSTGFRARVVPVSASLIGDVTSLIKDPEIPDDWVEGKQKTEPNPANPLYIRALAEADKRRGNAAMDALILFGVELLDPLPKDGKWLKKLQYLEKRGTLSLALYNLQDPDDIEFLFKRYIAVSADDIITVSKLSGIRGEDLKMAEESFRG